VRVYEGDGLGSFYYSLLRDIHKEGRDITTRGHRCREIIGPVTLVYKKPGACWMYIPGRKFNPFFAIAELIWILAGRGDVEWISYYNSKMRQFADGTNPEFHGSYGVRMRHWSIDAGEMTPVDQIQDVILKLWRDSYSRQAVICLWDPLRDNSTVVSNDIPCNNLVYYSLRDGVLDQTVVIRSNDVVLGAPINAIQFTHLHALVAGELAVKMGTFTYVVQNLHYYLDDDFSQFSLTEKLLLLGMGGKDGPGAQVARNFETIRLKEFGYLAQSIFKTGRDWLKGEGVPVYWGNFMPRMLHVYKNLKERPEQRGDSVMCIFNFEPLFQNLIFDFYSETKNDEIRATMEDCKREIAFSGVEKETRWL